MTSSVNDSKAAVPKNRLDLIGTESCSTGKCIPETMVLVNCRHDAQTSLRKATTTNLTLSPGTGLLKGRLAGTVREGVKVPSWFELRSGSMSGSRGDRAIAARLCDKPADG